MNEPLLKHITNKITIYTEVFLSKLNQIEILNANYNPHTSNWNIFYLEVIDDPKSRVVIYDGLTLVQCCTLIYKHLFKSVIAYVLDHPNSDILFEKVPKEEILQGIEEKINLALVEDFNYFCEKGGGFRDKWRIGDLVACSWSIASQELVINMREGLRHDLKYKAFEEVLKNVSNNNKDIKKRYAYLNKKFGSIFDRNYPHGSNYNLFYEVWQTFFHENFLLKEAFKKFTQVNLKYFPVNTVIDDIGELKYADLMIETFNESLFNCYWIEDNLLKAFSYTDLIPNIINFKKVIDQGVFFLGKTGLSFIVDGVHLISYWISFFQREIDGQLTTYFLSFEENTQAMICGFIGQDWDKTLDEWSSNFNDGCEDTKYKKIYGIAKILYQILLYMQQEPEDRQREYITAQRPYKATKNKNEIPQYRPIVIGEGYQIKTVYQRSQGGALGARSHSSEIGEKGSPKSPHWRRGHYRSQMYGSREKPQHKTVWIEPRFIQGSKISEEPPSEAIFTH